MWMMEVFTCKKVIKFLLQSVSHATFTLYKSKFPLQWTLHSSLMKVQYCVFCELKIGYILIFTHILRLRQDGRHVSRRHFQMHLKIVGFWLNFHWNIFARVQLTIIQHRVRLWLGAQQATSHYLNQWWSVYWRIYASLGLNELRASEQNKYNKIIDLTC